MCWGKATLIVRESSDETAQSSDQPSGREHRRLIESHHPSRAQPMIHRYSIDEDAEVIDDRRKCPADESIGNLSTARWNLSAGGSQSADSRHVGPRDRPIDGGLTRKPVITRFLLMIDRVAPSLRHWNPLTDRLVVWSNHPIIIRQAKRIVRCPVELA